MVFYCLSYNTKSTIRYWPLTLLPACLLNGIVRWSMILYGRKLSYLMVDSFMLEFFDINCLVVYDYLKTFSNGWKWPGTFLTLIRKWWLLLFDESISAVMNLSLNIILKLTSLRSSKSSEDRFMKVFDGAQSSEHCAQCVIWTVKNVSFTNESLDGSLGRWAINIINTVM